MRKLLAFLLCLMFFACGAEEPAPTAEEIAENALPLISLAASCPSFYTFEEQPGEEFAREAIAAYRLTVEDSVWTDEEIYALLFSAGELLPAEEEEASYELLTVQVTVDSAVDCGNGDIKVSFTCYEDFGEGFEFSYQADLYLRPWEESPWGARICRVFLPE